MAPHQYWQDYSSKSITGDWSHSRDYIALVKGDIKRLWEDQHFKTVTRMEVTLNIAVTRPQRANVWAEMWPQLLWQLFKTWFEGSNSTYANLLTNLTERDPTSYRKVMKDLSMTLAEAVSRLCKERTAKIKRLLGQMQQLTPAEGRVHTQGNSHPLPVDQPTINSF